MAMDEMEAMYNRLMLVAENVKIAEELKIFSPEDLRVEQIVHFNLFAPDDEERMGWFWTREELPYSWEFQQSDNPSISQKPKGYWFCPGYSDWEDRCKEIDKDFLYDYPEYRALGKRVLTVTTPTEYLLFRCQFNKIPNQSGLDWREVAKRYDGIEINYGVSSVFFDPMFRPWDLSSGCIWRYSADDDKNKTTHAMISGPPKTNRARSITNPRRNRFII
jgi:hypothetical protein